jgi:hypothetical protein
MSDYESSDDCYEPPPKDHLEWFEANYDAIEELWDAVRTAGHKLFGGAFLQFSNIGEFAHYVYQATVV